MHRILASTKKDIFSYTINKRVKVTLDFVGKAAKYREQLDDHFRIYDPLDIGTAINLKHWAAGRGVPYTIKVHKFFCWWSWGMRFLILYDYFCFKWYGETKVESMRLDPGVKAAFDDENVPQCAILGFLESTNNPESS